MGGNHHRGANLCNPEARCVGFKIPNYLQFDIFSRRVSSSGLRYSFSYSHFQLPELLLSFYYLLILMSGPVLAKSPRRKTLRRI